MKPVDVLVVGGGLAGCVAALAATREAPSAAVELVVTDDNRFDRHAGTIDVLGYPPRAGGGSDRRLAERPLEALADLPASHPYRQLGVERLRAALGLFDDAVGYRGDRREANALVVTHAGRVRPAARYPASMAPGLASRDEPMGLVGFEQAPDLDAGLVADRLDERLPYEVTGTTVEFPGTVTAYPSAPTLARALDEDRAPGGEAGRSDRGERGADAATQGVEGGGQPVREPLVERVLPEVDIEGRVGFPAVLGETEHEAVRHSLEGSFYADVFEVPIGPPSIPGRRLERRLHGALESAGVTVTHDTVECVESADRIGRVSLAGGARTVGSVVLATGDLAGPGLVADRSGVHERVFDCHVDHPADRLDWTEPRLLGAHAAARFGVSVDDDLRVLDADGHPEYENLRAAGRIVGGFDYDAEHSADGVALATGHAAGRWSLP